MGKTGQSGISRRNLLRGVASSALLGGLSATSKAKGRRSPQENIAVAVIGAGGMGTYHIEQLLKRRDVELLAVADVYEPQRLKAKQKIGNHCALYNDYRYILDRKDIDAVLIATPDHWHTLIACHAAEAGKDIYCEKPLTLTIGEGRPLLQTVQRYGRVFQVGSQQRSDPNFRRACELVRSGKLGKIHTVQVGFGGAPVGGDTRVVPVPAGLDWKMYSGPAPLKPFQQDRYGFNFRWFYDYSGGMVTDWGAHQFDIAQWGLGMDESGPIEVEGFGTFPTRGVFETATSFELLYTYANGVRMRCSNLQHGVRFIGTEGWLLVDRGVLEASPAEILDAPLGTKDVHLPASPGHHEDWLSCIRTRQKTLCPPEIGFRSATVCHLGNIALRLNRTLHWNPQTEQIMGDEEASRWLHRPYRAPYRL